MATMPDFSLPQLPSELQIEANDEAVNVAGPELPATVDSAANQDSITGQNASKKTNQIPPWMVIAAVVVMISVPLLLLLVSGGNSEQTSQDNSNGPTPTRTVLITPTNQPTPKTTPSVDLTSTELEVTPTPTIALSPTLTITPTAASQSNLLVDEVFFEDPQTGQKLDGQLYAGQHVSLRAKVRNTGTADAKNFVSYWKYQGDLVGRNATGSLKAGSTAVYDDVNSLVYSGITLKEGDVTIAYFVDPDNLLGEATTADNSKSSTVKIAATRSDLEVTDIELYHPQTGEKIAIPSIGQQVLVKPVIKNLGQDKQYNYDIKWYINGAEVKRSTIKQWLAVGESLVVSEGYTHTFAGGTTELKAEINPDKAIPETNSGNNVRIKPHGL